MVYDLKGRKALITGGGRGLGAAIVREFAKEGCHIAITYLSNEDKANGIAKEMEDAHSINTAVIQGDMSKQEDCYRVVAESIQKLGGLDIVINNGGDSKIADFKDVHALSESDWDYTFAINIKSILFLFQAVLDTFNSNPEGGIFLIMSSIAGVMTNGNSLAYSVCRAGGLHLMKCLAATHGPKVRVNAVAPGLVQTERSEALTEERIEGYKNMAVLDRITTTEDVALAFVFAAKNPGLTGERIRVDSGMVIT